MSETPQVCVLDWHTSSDMEEKERRNSSETEITMSSGHHNCSSSRNFLSKLMKGELHQPSQATMEEQRDHIKAILYKRGYTVVSHNFTFLSKASVDTWMYGNVGPNHKYRPYIIDMDTLLGLDTNKN